MPATAPSAFSVRSAEKWVQNFEDWNDIQNRFNLKCTDKSLRYPKGLVKAAIKLFLEHCQTYHIDGGKFTTLRITGDEVTWQVDFHSDDDETGPHFSIYEIFYDSRNKRILQSCFTLG